MSQQQQLDDSGNETEKKTIQPVTKQRSSNYSLIIFLNQIEHKHEVEMKVTGERLTESAH